MEYIRLTTPKLFLHDTLASFCGLDIILLCEVACMMLPESFFPDYTIDFVPSSSPGRAGEGV